MNDMHHAIETFSKYSPPEKIDFLVQFAHALTILARDTYAVEEDSLTNPARLRIINEIQHRVTGFLMALRKNDAKRDPDDVLVRIILEPPEDLDHTCILKHILAFEAGAVNLDPPSCLGSMMPY